MSTHVAIRCDRYVFGTWQDPENVFYQLGPNLACEWCRENQEWPQWIPIQSCSKYLWSKKNFVKKSRAENSWSLEQESLDFAHCVNFCRFPTLQRRSSCLKVVNTPFPVRRPTWNCVCFSLFPPLMPWPSCPETSWQNLDTNFSVLWQNLHLVLLCVSKFRTRILRWGIYTQELKQPP